MNNKKETTKQKNTPLNILLISSSTNIKVYDAKFSSIGNKIC